MRIEVQPRPAPVPTRPVPAPSLDHAGASREIRLRVDRLEVQGFGPVSPHALREGFRETWVNHRASAELLERETVRDRFAHPLELTGNVSGGYELGRMIARAILHRATEKAGK